ncbi:hypothetical protein L208DRAFT_1417045 [Tricholoma matsutake]|nr:hypothetical protein L208DRAFT_1417045 [Tricholoma matsutake 945]
MPRYAGHIFQHSLLVSDVLSPFNVFRLRQARFAEIPLPGDKLDDLQVLVPC